MENEKKNDVERPSEQESSQKGEGPHFLIQDIEDTVACSSCSGCAQKEAGRLQSSESRASVEEAKKEVPRVLRGETDGERAPQPPILGSRPSREMDSGSGSVSLDDYKHPADFKQGDYDYVATIVSVWKQFGCAGYFALPRQLSGNHFGCWPEIVMVHEKRYSFFERVQNVLVYTCVNDAGTSEFSVALPVSRTAFVPLAIPMVGGDFSCLCEVHRQSAIQEGRSVRTYDLDFVDANTAPRPLLYICPKDPEKDHGRYYGKVRSGLSRIKEVVADVLHRSPPVEPSYVRRSDGTREETDSDGRDDREPFTYERSNNKMGLHDQIVNGRLLDRLRAWCTLLWAAISICLPDFIASALRNVGTHLRKWALVFFRSPLAVIAAIVVGGIAGFTAAFCLFYRRNRPSKTIEHTFGKLEAKTKEKVEKLSKWSTFANKFSKLLGPTVKLVAAFSVMLGFALAMFRFCSVLVKLLKIFDSGRKERQTKRYQKYFRNSPYWDGEMVNLGDNTYVHSKKKYTDEEGSTEHVDPPLSRYVAVRGPDYDDNCACKRCRRWRQALKDTEKKRTLNFIIYEGGDLKVCRTVFSDENDYRDFKKARKHIESKPRFWDWLNCLFDPEFMMNYLEKIFLDAGDWWDSFDGSVLIGLMVTVALFVPAFIFTLIGLKFIDFFQAKKEEEGKVKESSSYSNFKLKTDYELALDEAAGKTAPKKVWKKKEASVEGDLHPPVTQPSVKSVEELKFEEANKDEKAPTPEQVKLFEKFIAKGKEKVEEDSAVVHEAKIEGKPIYKINSKVFKPVKIQEVRRGGKNVQKKKQQKKKPQVKRNYNDVSNNFDAAQEVEHRDFTDQFGEGRWGEDENWQEEYDQDEWVQEQDRHDQYDRDDERDLRRTMDQRDREELEERRRQDEEYRMMDDIDDYRTDARAYREVALKPQGQEQWQKKVKKRDCPHFYHTGRCNKGNGCAFEHNLRKGDSQEPDLPICRKKNCTYGNKCYFKHVEKQEPPKQEAKRVIQLKETKNSENFDCPAYFYFGKCNWTQVDGAKCGYHHVIYKGGDKQPNLPLCPRGVKCTEILGNRGIKLCPYVCNIYKCNKNECLHLRHEPNKAREAAMPQTRNQKKQARQQQLPSVITVEPKKEVGFATSPDMDVEDAKHVMLPLSYKFADGTEQWINATAIGSTLVTAAHLFGDSDKTPDPTKAVVKNLLTGEQLKVLRVDWSKDLAAIEKPSGMKSKFQMAQKNDTTVTGINPHWVLEKTGTPRFKISAGQTYKGYHQISTDEGYCGSPILVKQGNSTAIAGLHYLGSPQSNEMIPISIVQDFCNSGMQPQQGPTQPRVVESS
jgi:hypothetical protein